MSSVGDTAAAPLPGSDWCRLQQDGGDLEVTAIHDEQIPHVEPDAYGGHESVKRPGKRPMTPWRGPGQVVLKFGVLLDADPEMRFTRAVHPPVGGRQAGKHPLIWNPKFYEDSVEQECRDLEQMAGGLMVGDPEPPPLIVSGPMVPHGAERASGNRWVIAPQGIEWGDAMKRSTDGARIRQQVSLTLWLYVASKSLQVDPGAVPPRYRVFVSTKALNTYRKIAAHKLGTPHLGNKLAQLNGARDQNKALAPGTRVRLPTAHTLADWRHGH